MGEFVFSCGCTHPLIGHDGILYEQPGRPLPLGLDIDIYDLPHDCPRTWQLICDGNTKGVFQLEGHLGRIWARQLKPDSLKEVAALISIIRPGCANSKSKPYVMFKDNLQLTVLDKNEKVGYLNTIPGTKYELNSHRNKGGALSLEFSDGSSTIINDDQCILFPAKSMTKHYCDRKNKIEDIEYMHPALEPIMKHTYGILCIHEDTYISMADGTEKKIKDINIDNEVISINQSSFKSVVDKCSDICISPLKYGYRLILENGYNIILTEDHEVITQRGKVKVCELDKENDVVQIVVNQIRDNTKKSRIDSGDFNDICTNKIRLSYLCGQLIGDGGAGYNIASGTEHNHNILYPILSGWFPKLNITQYFNGSWYIGISGNDLLLDSHYGNRKTKYRWFIEQLGLDKTKDNKIICDDIFKLEDETRRAFLAGLFDADGHSSISSNRITNISHYCSSNPQIINGIRKLLSLDGIKTYIDNTGVHVIIIDTERFYNLIGPYIKLKPPIGKLLDGRSYGSYPKNLVRELIYKNGYTNLKKFSLDNNIGETVLTNRRTLVDINTAQKAGIKFNDISYMKIKDIIKIDSEQKFYSISIRENHNLIGNGIVIHNCYQETAMQLSVSLASFNMQQADVLRKCIAGYERMNTSDGDIRIDELVDSKYLPKIYTIDSDGIIIKKRLKRVWSSGKQHVWKMTLSNGRSITATKNHKIFTDLKWVELKDIDYKNRVYCIDGSYNPVLFSYEGEIDTYDYEVDDDNIHYGFVNGLLVHNSIGKKKADLMAKVKGEFLTGAKITATIPFGQAEEIFGWIEQSQKYSFNASHAYSYGELSYWTAYLKAHAPKQFYCSYINGAGQKADVRAELAELVSNAQINDVIIRVPSIIDLRLEPYIKDENVYFGLSNVKNIGLAAQVKLMQAIRKATTSNHRTLSIYSVDVKREFAKFSWSDYLFKISDNISSTTNVSLIESGALDHFGLSRNKMLFEYDKYKKLSTGERIFVLKQEGSLVDRLRKCAKLKSEGGGCHDDKRLEIVKSLIDVLENPPHLLADSPEYISTAESSYLGTSITCCKVDGCADGVNANASCREVFGGRRGILGLAVEITRVQIIKTKNGKNPGQSMAFISMRDSSCEIDSGVVFPSEWAIIENLFYVGNTLLVVGELSKQSSFVIKKAIQI